MSLRGIANGDAVAIPRKGHLVNPTQDTFVLAWRKRNKQAKDKQLSLATIVWSKVQFIPHSALPYCFSARFMKDLPFLFAMSNACAAPPKS